MLRFNRKYFLIAVVLFVIEVLIATYVHDKIIRPYIGDVLVVILIYCFVRSFLKVPVLPTAASVLIFSFVIEALQAFSYVERLGLGNSKLARIVLGSSFVWMDLVAYTVGIVIVISAEKIKTRTNLSSSSFL
jgi:hypothetical protein